jgi:hypothetical protein
VVYWKESEEIQINKQTSHFVKGTALILRNSNEISQVNKYFQFKVCKSVHHRSIQINQQPAPDDGRENAWNMLSCK